MDAPQKSNPYGLPSYHFPYSILQPYLPVKYINPPWFLIHTFLFHYSFFSLQAYWLLGYYYGRHCPFQIFSHTEISRFKNNFSTVCNGSLIPECADQNEQNVWTFCIYKPTLNDGSTIKKGELGTGDLILPLPAFCKNRMNPKYLLHISQKPLNT